MYAIYVLLVCLPAFFDCAPYSNVLLFKQNAATDETNNFEVENNEKQNRYDFNTTKKTQSTELDDTKANAIDEAFQSLFVNQNKTQPSNLLQFVSKHEKPVMILGTHQTLLVPLPNLQNFAASLSGFANIFSNLQTLLPANK